MELFPILFFFILAYCAGHSLTRKLGWHVPLAEKIVMRVGLGIAGVIVLGLVLNLVRVPLDWRIILLVVGVLPLLDAWRNRSSFKISGKISVKKETIVVAAVGVVFLLSLYMYSSGADAYPYLENDDPWGHASAIKYVALEKTAFAPANHAFHYLDPYPPSYDMFFGVLHQTSSSLQWTMKFFNALLISLSLPFFYFFARRFTGNAVKAFFATLVLAAVPAYLSHFIWSPALAMVLFFPALYFLEHAVHGRKWLVAAAVAVGGLFVAHPTHAVVLGAMLGILVAVTIFVERKIRVAQLYGLIFGGIVSLAWWGVRGPRFVSELRGSYNPAGIENYALQTGLVDKAWGLVLRIFPKWSGTATRAYSFDDFFVAKGQNLINNPVGLGSVAVLTGILGTLTLCLKVIRGRKHLRAQRTAIITLLWLALTVLVVNNITFDLPIGFFAFRTWMILAVPLALVAAEGILVLFSLSKLVQHPGAAVLVKGGVTAVIVLGLFLTSAQQKYEVNTAMWPPGAFWTSTDEVGAFVWLKENLPVDTGVFAYGTDDQVLGMDMMSCGWCSAVSSFRQDGINATAEETHAFLSGNGYEYVVISGMDAKRYGADVVNVKLQEFATSGRFEPVVQNNGAVILKVL